MFNNRILLIINTILIFYKAKNWVIEEKYVFVLHILTNINSYWTSVRYVNMYS